MKTSWQTEVRNFFKSNTRIIIRNGKREFISFITWKKIQEIINKEKRKGFDLDEETVIQYAKTQGTIIPYKEEDLDKLYELADMQNKGKELQEFEKKVCEKKVAELIKKQGTVEISNKAILELGLCTPAEVVYAINYRDLLCTSLKPKKEEIEDKNSRDAQLIRQNKDIFQKEIEDIFLKKEQRLLEEGALHKVGNMSMITPRELRLSLNKIHIRTSEEIQRALKKIRVKKPLSPDNRKLIEGFITEVRDKRKDHYIKQAIDSYNELCNIISKNIGISMDEITNESDESSFLNLIEMAKEKKPSAEQEHIEELRDKYITSRTVQFFYYERLLRWAAHLIKTNSHSAIDTTQEELIEFISEIYLKAYYDYIRKYDRTSNKHHLTTYIINRITSNFKTGGIGVYAGSRLSKELYHHNNVIFPVAISNISKVYANKRVIEETEMSLASQLLRKPTIHELALTLGLTPEDLRKQLDEIELVERGTESLDELREKSFIDSTIPISSEMKEAIQDGYDEFALEEDYPEMLERDMEDFETVNTEEGIIPDYQEDSEIIGHETLPIYQIFREEIVQEILAQLDPKEREVIELRNGFTDGKVRTLEEVGKMMGVGKERIRQIEARAYIKLRRIILTYDIRDLFKDDDYYDPMNMPDAKKRK